MPLFFIIFIILFANARKQEASSPLALDGNQNFKNNQNGIKNKEQEVPLSPLPIIQMSAAEMLKEARKVNNSNNAHKKRVNYRTKINKKNLFQFNLKQTHTDRLKKMNTRAKEARQTLSSPSSSQSNNNDDEMKFKKHDHDHGHKHKRRHRSHHKYEKLFKPKRERRQRIRRGLYPITKINQEESNNKTSTKSKNEGKNTETETNNENHQNNEKEKGNEKESKNEIQKETKEVKENEIKTENNKKETKTETKENENNKTENKEIKTEKQKSLWSKAKINLHTGITKWLFKREDEQIKKIENRKDKKEIKNEAKEKGSFLSNENGNHGDSDESLLPLNFHSRSFHSFHSHDRFESNHHDRRSRSYSRYFHRIPRAVLSINQGWFGFQFGPQGTMVPLKIIINLLPSQTGVLKVSDYFCKGDSFIIYDNGRKIGETPYRSFDKCRTNTENPNYAFKNKDLWSTGHWTLEPGIVHKITIKVKQSPAGGGGGAIRVDSLFLESINDDIKIDTRHTKGDFLVLDTKLPFHMAAKACHRIGMKLANIDIYNFLDSTDVAFRVSGPFSQTWIRSWNGDSYGKNVDGNENRAECGKDGACLVLSTGAYAPGGSINIPSNCNIPLNVLCQKNCAKDPFPQHEMHPIRSSNSHSHSDRRSRSLLSDSLRLRTRRGGRWRWERGRSCDGGNQTRKSCHKSNLEKSWFENGVDNLSSIKSLETRSEDFNLSRSVDAFRESVEQWNEDYDRDRDSSHIDHHDECSCSQDHICNHHKKKHRNKHHKHHHSNSNLYTQNQSKSNESKENETRDYEQKSAFTRSRRNQEESKRDEKSSWTSIGKKNLEESFKQPPISASPMQSPSFPSSTPLLVVGKENQSQSQLQDQSQISLKDQDQEHESNHEQEHEQVMEGKHESSKQQDSQEESQKSNKSQEESHASEERERDSQTKSHKSYKNENEDSNRQTGSQASQTESKSHEQEKSQDQEQHEQEKSQEHEDVPKFHSPIRIPILTPSTPQQSVEKKKRFSKSIFIPNHLPIPPSLSKEPLIQSPFPLPLAKASESPSLNKGETKETKEIKKEEIKEMKKEENKETTQQGSTVKTEKEKASQSSLITPTTSTLINSNNSNGVKNEKNTQTATIKESISPIPSSSSNPQAKQQQTQTKSIESVKESIRFKSSLVATSVPTPTLKISSVSTIASVPSSAKIGESLIQKKNTTLNH